MRTAARLLAVGWLFHFKMLSRSAFDGLLGVMWPLFFATVAFFMFRAGGGEQTLLYASLGAAVMGIWSVTSTSAGAAMQRERWNGTLEVLVASPAPFALVLLPVTIAMTTIGLYCLVATLLWGRLLFGIELHIEQPLYFAASIPVAIVSIGTFGFLLAVGNVLEYPVWLICGFLVPLTLLPDWVRPISWLLAPTWGMRAIRESALGGSPWPDLALCVGLAGGYVLVGVLVLDSALRAARARAALALT
jgi:ABC-2 type transport system permease protein